jgi:hypothetical protein
MSRDRSTYAPPAVSTFGVGIAPGELISCALLALLAGVRKSAFLFTVLPLTPVKALGRGVFGTNPSSLHDISPTHHSRQVLQPTYRTCPLPSLWVLAVCA